MVMATPSCMCNAAKSSLLSYILKNKVIDEKTAWD